jgi:hypothetical protein
MSLSSFVFTNELKASVLLKNSVDKLLSLILILANSSYLLDTIFLSYNEKINPIQMNIIMTM